MPQTKTFQNLSILEQARQTAQETLKEKYTEAVNSFIVIIERVMKSNEINHFEAMKMIQDKTDLSDAPDKKIMFATALMEILEVKNLK